MAKHFFLSNFQDTYRCFDKKRAKSQENYVTKLIIGLNLQIEKKRDKKYATWVCRNSCFTCNVPIKFHIYGNGFE